MADHRPRKLSHAQSAVATGKAGRPKQRSTESRGESPRGRAAAAPRNESGRGPSVDATRPRRDRQQVVRRESARGSAAPASAEVVTEPGDPSARKPRHRAPTGMRPFASFGLPDPLVEALAQAGIVTTLPIQAATLRDGLVGRDILGRARTGSGKTLAFGIPMLVRLAGRRSEPRRPRGIVMAPTRELANQIHSALAPLAAAVGLRTVAVYGGASAGPQIQALRRGVDIVVATPGRLDDHARSGNARLDDVEIAVVDEADHMSDLGFLPDLCALLDRMPANGQRLLFSATLDGDVDVLVQRYLDQPKTHSVDDESDAADATSHHVLQVDSGDRFAVMADLAQAPGRTIVFTRTRLGAAKLAEQFTRSGVAAVELHGDLSQSVRARNLRAFTQGRATTLVATDIAARGIHVDDVALVLHADPPDEHKAYVHRSGRTARAGAQGTVVTMATGRQTRLVRELTRRAGVEATTTRVWVGHPLLLEIAPGERTEQFLAPEPAAVRQGKRPSRNFGEARGPKSPRRPGGAGVRSRASGGNAGAGAPTRTRGSTAAEAPSGRDRRHAPPRRRG